MSFYIRKSLKAGPIRFNFSKSGVGISAGIPGLRFGSGPRGNYVHMGRAGLYYRRTLPVFSEKDVSQEAFSTTGSAVEMKEIESESILSFQDASAADLLNEINEKQRKNTLWPFFGVVLLIILAILYTLNVAYWLIGILAIISVIGTYLLSLYDKYSKSFVVYYELESEAEARFKDLYDGFISLAGCHKSWHVEAKGEITNLQDWKRNAGAQALVKLQSFVPKLGSPPIFRTNIKVPILEAGLQTLYFFPDRIFIFEGKTAGAIPYDELVLEKGNTNFVETDTVPNDAKVIGHTWRYVNKKGGPDRRFKDNPQIPICLYTQIHFKSQRGLNELFQFSKAETGDELLSALSNMAKERTTG